VALEYRLDSINDFLLFSSLSGTVPEQSPVVISVRLNTDTIRQHYEENMQSLSDKILVFIDDMPPSELEVIISMDPDMDLSDNRNNDLRKVPTSTYDACCKICNIENDAELHIK
jgi:hypothetical protein